MELLLINHPLDCPVCDKGGECPLQNQAMSNGRAESRFEDVKRTYPKPINISSQVLLDRERCVLCARCTRFSDQIAGDPFIALVERGALQQVGIYEEQPFESYFSGNTVQICPVGALTGAAYRFRARPFDLVSTPERLRALRERLRDPHRPPPRLVLRRMAAERPGGQRGVELRQGPLGLHRTPRCPTASSSRWSVTRTASCGRLLAARPSRPRPPACAPRERRRRARRWPGQRRGRLRLRQVRPHRPRHQRRRLPRPPALGRGGRLPRLARRRHRPRRRRGHLRRPRGRQDRRPRRASSPRTRARSSSCGCARRSARTRPPCMPWRPSRPAASPRLGGTLIPTAPGTEPEVLARPRRRRHGHGDGRHRPRGQALRDERASSSSASASRPSPAP